MKYALVFLLTLACAPPARAERTVIEELRLDLSTVQATLTQGFRITGRELRAVATVDGMLIRCPLATWSLVEERGAISTSDPAGRDRVSWRTRTWRVVCNVGAGTATVTRTVQVSHRKEPEP